MLPADLKNRLREHKVIPVVGAGVSISTAGAPTWNGLIKDALAYGKTHHVDTKVLATATFALDNEQPIIAAETIQSALTKAGVFSEFLRSKFDNPPITSQDLIQAIAALNPPFIATTNYDRLLETVIGNGVPTETWQNAESLLDMFRHFGIFHLHGVYTKPKTVILGAGDYARLGEQTAYAAFMRALWTGYTLLFVGYSLDGVQDPDISSLFQWAKATFGTPTFPHYMLLPSSEYTHERARELRILGVEIVNIDLDVTHPADWITENLGNEQAKIDSEITPPDTVVEALQQLLEGALINVGATVAKAIIKAALPGNDVAKKSVSSVFELFKSKDKGLLEKRKAGMLIDNIGYRIVESLAPVFAREGAKLGENGRVNVACAVSATLDAAKITPEVLIERDLAPRKVLALLHESQPDTCASLDIDETAFYERMIEEASQQIVDVASQLDFFTERTYAEILQRERQILEAVDRMIADLEAIRQQTLRDDPRAAAVQFEEEYRRAVARNLDVLELFGANVSLASRRHSLSIAYVTLSVSRSNLKAKPSSKSSDIDDNRFSPEPLSMHGEDRIETHAATDVLSAIECLSSTNRLLIRGVAGAGKTTLLQWIAVKSALNGFEAPLADWNDTVPFFIRLRHCAEGSLPAPNQFPSLVSSTIAEGMPAGWVKEQLLAGRGLVLIDGVDEVSEARQEDIRIWLRDLVGTYGKNRFVVSARRHIDEDWLEGEEFESAETQPMDVSQIKAFIEHWHAAAKNGLRDDAEIAKLEQYSRDLQSAVVATVPLRKLATNPLLCAMLCALHRERLTHLPKDRIQLYRECIQLLLERREKLRGIDYSEYPDLSLRQQELLLQELSYYLVTNEWSSIEWEKASDRLQPKLAAMEGIPSGATVEKVLRYFVERSGVVREPVKGRIDFIHRTFQEFFAAQAAIDARDIGVLIKNAHDPEWREILILATGLARDKERDDLIGGLVRRGDNILNRKHRHRLHLLAAACLETALSIDPYVKAESQKRIAGLLPLKNNKDVTAFASAGDLAVPYLLRSFDADSGDTAVQRALAGRCLSVVGDPRPGVGLRSDGLPDIDWCNIPTGNFIYQDGEQRTLPPFQISKYPVTYCQFQAFVDDPKGYCDSCWWRELHPEAREYQIKGIVKQALKYSSNPIEGVSWYDAMAFCAWLSNKLGYAVTLPTEAQWEKAARGPEGLIYPYGNEFDAAKANTLESGIGQASTVGIFVDGISSYGVADMSGNIWEWTLTGYGICDETDLGSNSPRVLRGGSWDNGQHSSRAVNRLNHAPDDRDRLVGFRLASFVTVDPT